MPRILIADDNSNIQRMAALALKDAGIEVIAVGNGEAAVRKLPEIMPDLVLADIFMPVRNGYEVCEFVKRDARYANIPVLLLAGAFDPFDEQEAQRVHADGVLKKPFVPPDPLINAVKTLLAKSAGERLMAVTVPVAAASAESGKAAVAAATRVAEPPAEQTPYEPPEELALPLTRDDRGTHEKTAAFAPSAKSAVAETEEAESVVTASRDPSLGEPAFWVPAEEPAEEATDEDLTDHTWFNEGHTAPLRDDRAPDEELAPAGGVQRDNLGVSGPISQDLLQDFIDPAVMEGLAALAASALTAASVVTATPVETAAPAGPTAPIADSVSTKGRSAEDTLPLPEAWVESAALEMEPLKGSSSSESSASAASSLPAVAPIPSSSPLAPPPSPSPLTSEAPAIPAAPAWVSERAREEEMTVLELSASLPEWGAPLHASQEHEPEPEPESAAKEQVAQVAMPEPQTESHEQVASAEPEAEQKSETAPQEAESEPELGIEWPPAFIPAISSDVSDARTPALRIVPAAQATPDASAVTVASGAPVASVASEPVATPDPLPLALPGAGAASLSPADVEAAVQRVIDRMQPQIIELVTRDILRPLVEALVQQELKR